MSNSPIATTLIDAAKKFAHESYDTSTMRKVLINMVRYNEATRTLIQEMELLEKDLR